MAETHMAHPLSFPDSVPRAPLTAEFKSLIHELSDAILATLERRHLEYLDLSGFPFPVAAGIRSLRPGERQFLRLMRLGHSSAVDRGLNLISSIKFFPKSADFL